MKKGFTLIELLVVVLIIGILAAVALPQYQTAIERSRATEALTLMNSVSSSLQRYHAQHDVFPSAANDFAKLDVDIPCIESSNGVCTEHGGKFFILRFGRDGNTASILAIRRPDDLYTLNTSITALADGSYLVVRSCSPKSGNADAQDYCNAITGGHNNDF